MAIFTALASGQVLTGTDNPDLFILSAATSLSIFGQGGNDTVDGFQRTGAISQAFITLNGGADLVVLTGSASSSVVQLGAGGDTMVVSSEVASSRIFAGDGSDNVQIYDSASTNTILMGAGADSLFISEAVSGSTIGMGAGADTLRTLDDVLSSDIQLGGGNDLMVISGFISASTVDAGDGLDTVRVDGIASSTVLLGNDADKLFASSVTADSVIDGGAGGDTIIISGDIASSQIFGGQGNDSIYLFNGGNAQSSLIDGGDGVDTIYVGSSNNNEINVIGGQGADLIQFSQTSDIDVKYTNASESNVNTFDTLQVVDYGGGDTATAWISVSAVLPQQVKVGSGIIGPNFNTDNSGRVTFKAGVGASLQARVSVLNEDLNAGEFVLFDAEGSQFVFMGGNNAASTEDDLVIRLADNTQVMGLDTAGNSRMRVEFLT